MFDPADGSFLVVSDVTVRLPVLDASGAVSTGGAVLSLQPPSSSTPASPTFHILDMRPP